MMHDIPLFAQLGPVRYVSTISAAKQWWPGGVKLRICGRCVQRAPIEWGMCIQCVVKLLFCGRLFIFEQGFDRNIETYEIQEPAEALSGPAPDGGAGPRLTSSDG